MTSSTAPSFAAQIGFSFLAYAGRAGHWALGRFMANPRQNISLSLLAIAMLFSAANALFWQTGRHPAPLFATQPPAPAFIEQAEAPHPAPLPLRDRGVSAPQAQPQIQIQPESQLEAGHEVSNEQLKMAQTILNSLGLYEGKIDGFYGPETAQALRAFELRNGFPPKGALTPQIISRILAAPGNSQPSAPRTISPEEVTLPLTSVPVEGSAQVAAPTTQTAEQPHGADPLAAITRSVALQTENSTQTQSVATAQAIPAQPLPAPLEPSVDVDLIKKIQRGLSSLAFLHGTIDGVAGEETARAIREFEVFNNLQVTGKITPDLVDLLLSLGATI